MILRNKDLQTFYCVSYPTASKLKRIILDSLGLRKPKLTIYDLARYEGIPVTDLRKFFDH